MVFDGTPYHCHAKTGTASSHLFFAVEWFKNSRQVIRRDADTFVSDAQVNVFSFRNRLIRLLGVIQVPVTGANFDSCPERKETVPWMMRVTNASFFFRGSNRYSSMATFVSGPIEMMVSSEKTRALVMSSYFHFLSYLME